MLNRSTKSEFRRGLNSTKPRRNPIFVGTFVNIYTTEGPISLGALYGTNMEIETKEDDDSFLEVTSLNITCEDRF